MSDTLAAEAKPAVRLYKISDSAMLQFARLNRNMFLIDKPGFVALNPDFDGSFGADWLTAIETAEDAPTDEVVVDQQSQQTETVEEQMALCRQKYGQVIYYAGEAFDRKTILNEFGQNDYLDIRNKQNEMITFMGTLHATATKYKVQLIAKGYTQAKIDEIETLRDDLITANVQQQQLIKERPTTTADRIEKMNTVYRFCQKVNRASKQVFLGNYAKIQQYLLPASENAVHDLAFTGTVTAQETSAPIAGATVTIPALGLSTNTDEFGAFAFAQEIPDGTYSFTVSAAGKKDFTGSVTIVDGTTVTQNVAMIAA